MSELPFNSEDIAAVLSKLAGERVSILDVAQVISGTADIESTRRVSTALIMGGHPWLGAALIANKTLQPIIAGGIPLNPPESYKAVIIESLELAKEFLASTIVLEELAAADSPVENTVTNPSQGGTPEQTNTEEQV